MNHILFDDQGWSDLLPLTYTKPAAELRVGINTINEKWERALGSPFSHSTQDHLQEKFKLELTSDNLLINGRVCPDKMLVEAVKGLESGQKLVSGDVVVAARSNSTDHSECQSIAFEGDFTIINYPWDIFSKNGDELKRDYAAITTGRKSALLSDSNMILGGGDIFLEEGAECEGAILNTKNGPIYLGKDSEVMEGVVIRGPFALGESSTVKLSAKIYGPTTVGPHSKVGGEVNNSVIQGYSNKGHDGFLGNSVLGEWCNLGADTNNSNLKNNYAMVDCWSYSEKKYVHTGLQFCGLIMGDHSKTGINSMLNTGTVVGVSCNIYGADFPRKHVPSFSWGSSRSMFEYRPEKALETAERVMDRRGIALDDVERNLLTAVFNMTQEQRS